jgi:hypothetical protein
MSTKVWWVVRAHQTEHKESEKSTNMRKNQLVRSVNPGRLAVNDAQSGPDLTCGQIVEIELSGQWIRGVVEHAPRYGGYYFEAEFGGICALCPDMSVRLLYRDLEGRLCTYEP